MKRAGYVTAIEAAEAIGVSQVGTVHRMIQRDPTFGTQAGKHWYVSVARLLFEYRNAEPILERIRALGVQPNSEHKIPKGPELAKAKPSSARMKARKPRAGT